MDKAIRVQCYGAIRHDKDRAETGEGLILVSSRSLWLLDALRPPVEPRRPADEIGAGLQGDAALRLGVFQLLDASEVPVDQHAVGQRPQMFGWLQLWGIGRQEQQVDMLRHA